MHITYISYAYYIYIYMIYARTYMPMLLVYMTYTHMLVLGHKSRPTDKTLESIDTSHLFLFGKWQQ